MLSRGSAQILKRAKAHVIVKDMSRAENIAKELFMNCPYLSAKFKEEAGETLTDFIWKEKTEEAKRLLRYSDKSFSSIGAYLGFSSPGHFSQVFKKYTGKTPSEYRDRFK